MEQAFEEFTLSGVFITENELGSGSYGVVMQLKYRGLICAGKKLHRVLYENDRSGYTVQRFLEEFRLHRQCRHPNIVQFLGVCFEEGSQIPFLVMEFLPTNLTNCLERYGVLPDEINFSILHDVSLGLAYLHGLTPAIMHRDLSANSVLLSTNMIAKISDFGVSRILDGTQMTMTMAPGSISHMPPEAMVANPYYNTSIDVFSFGIMMIHTFTAEWPLPKIGPTRIDPTNPGGLIPVTEAERRHEFFQKITPDHPLLDFIMFCISNNPQQRPRAEEIVERMVGVVLKHPPSFENRVEMLQRVSALMTEKKELEEEVLRKDSAIQEKAGEIEALAEEKRRQEEESESTVERMQLAHSVKIDHLKLEYDELASSDHSQTHLQSNNLAKAMANPDRKFNIVVYGIKESPDGTSRQNRMLYDNQKVFDVLKTIDSAITVHSIRDCSRIGKYSNGKQRPVLVKMSRSCEVQSILAKRRNLPQTSSMSIKPEMSFKERSVEKILLKKRWELMGEGVEKGTIKIKGKTLFVGNERHGFVNGSIYMLCCNDNNDDENTTL